MTNKQKIEKILTEYPSHPPIKGSEHGLNLVTVDKLDALITQNCKQAIEKECNCYSNIQKVGRAHYVCTKCERDLSLDVVFAHRAGIDLLKKLNKKYDE